MSLINPDRITIKEFLLVGLPIIFITEFGLQIAFNFLGGS